MDARSVAREAAAGTLLVVGALHAAWGAGASWPMSSRAELSEVVLGSPGLGRESAAACYAVAGLLGAAAALVSGRPRQFDRPRRVAVTGVALVLAGRGTLGLAGRTDLVSRTSTGDRFRRLDRRLYSPLCLVLAALTWRSAR
jgi:hypothetical protein